MAHKQGLLRSYIGGDAGTVLYIEENLFLLEELFDHPLFKYDLSQQICDGVIKAWNMVQEAIGKAKEKSGRR